MDINTLVEIELKSTLQANIEDGRSVIYKDLASKARRPVGDAQVSRSWAEPMSII